MSIRKQQDRWWTFEFLFRTQKYGVKLSKLLNTRYRTSSPKRHMADSFIIFCGAIYRKDLSDISYYNNLRWCAKVLALTFLISSTFSHISIYAKFDCYCTLPKGLAKATQWRLLSVKIRPKFHVLKKMFFYIRTVTKHGNWLLQPTWQCEQHWLVFVNFDLPTTCQRGGTGWFPLFRYCSCLCHVIIKSYLLFFSYTYYINKYKSHNEI